MSVRRLAEQQPDNFAFTPENVEWARTQLAKYPAGRQASAVIPLLWRAQKQHGGWLPEPAIRYVADFLDMAYIRVLEVATFYTMFNLEPVGRHYVQLCGTTPCWLRGANALKEVCRTAIGPERTVSGDGALSWIEVECLGACVNAPMVQINDDFYEDLTAESLEVILTRLRNGEPVEPGPQTGRQSSEPEGGRRVLLGEPPYRDVPAWPEGGRTDHPEAEPTGKPESRAGEIGDGVPPEGDVAAPEADARREADAPAPVETAQEGNGDRAAAPRMPAEEGRPPAEEAPGGGADDLKMISGIGPKIESTLNSLGIYRFEQIARWTPEQVARIDGELRFKGRVEREGWIDQAAELANRHRGAEGGE